jgi:threonine synthase
MAGAAILDRQKTVRREIAMVATTRTLIQKAAVSGRTARYVAGAGSRSSGIWRYGASMPALAPVTLGEGGTPLLALDRVAAKAGGGSLLGKLECLNPTGSFKDRGSALIAAAARAAKSPGFAIASTGNAGASMAAYAARAGLPLTVIAPKSIDPGKLWQINAHGAHIDLCDGDFTACMAAYRDLVAGGLFAAGSDNELRQVGTKTIAYEMFEEADGPIDRVIAPVGTGGLVVSLLMGFADIAATVPGFRMPKIDAVQLDALRPLDGFDASRVSVRTAATGINIANPGLREDVLDAMRKTGGRVHGVGEADLLAAQELLATQEGVGAEPTASVATAAYIQARQRGLIGADERVVVIVTGHILKAPVQVVDRRAGTRA